MTSVLWWSVVLIALVLAAFVAVAQVKKRLVSSDDHVGAGFTLADLRQLHREGKMSTEEFEKAKLVIVSAAKKAAEREKKADPQKPAQEKPLPGADGPLP